MAEIFGTKQREDVLEIVDKGGNIAEYFSRTNSICKDIGSRIILGKQLGKGAYGAVYKVDIKDGESERSKRLVVKKMEVYTIKTIVENEERPIVSNFYKGENLDFTKELVVPEFLFGMCKYESYKLTNGKGKYRPPKEALFCNSEHTEFIISLWAGDLFTRGVSINFLPVFYFATCADFKKETANYYIFMEEIDSDLYNLLSVDEKASEHVYIQALHAIAVYQQYGAAVHGDLHWRNVFVSETPDTFNGESANVDFYEYRLGEDKSVYLPGPKKGGGKYVAKIGDWGMAVKYGPTTLIGDSSVIYGLFKNNPKPNWYNESYDVISLTRSFYYKRPNNKFVQKIMAWIEQSDTAPIAQRNFFPDVKILDEKYSHVTPVAILSSPELMGDYLTVPDENEKIAVFGSL